MINNINMLFGDRHFHHHLYFYLVFTLECEPLAAAEANVDTDSVAYIRVHTYLPSITHTATFHIFTPFHIDKSKHWLPPPQSPPSSRANRSVTVITVNTWLIMFCHQGYLPWEVIISDVIPPVCYFLWAPGCGGSAQQHSGWKHTPGRGSFSSMHSCCH